MRHDKTILILGGTGFVGQEIGLKLCTHGYKIIVSTRHPEQWRGRLPFPCELVAFPSADSAVDSALISRCHVVINLVGAGIADKPWTSSRRQVLRESRLRSVAALAAAISAAERKPVVVVQASAVGYYGDSGEADVTEATCAGRGFLADLAKDWETSTEPIAAAGSRLVTLRMGMVLGLTGGALPKLLDLYAMGLGGVLGNGRQWLSWIHVDDLTELIVQVIAVPSYRGVINATAPIPCRMSEFNEAIGGNGKYFHAWRVPRLALQAVLGARAALVLESIKVLPLSAIAAGFEFRFPAVGAAFADLLGGSVAGGVVRLVERQWIRQDPATVWPFFTNAANLERITPPWLGFKVLNSSTPVVQAGTLIDYVLKLHGVPMRWRTEICAWNEGKSFVDRQVQGPYAVWHHTHNFTPLAGGSLMTDIVQYKLPLSHAGALVAGGFVGRDVRQIFSYRRKVIAWLSDRDFELSDPAPLVR